MTQDEIIEMARQAGMIADGEMWFSPSYENCDVHIAELEAFAKLVAAKYEGEIQDLKDMIMELMEQSE
jgi:hypothetical protein